MTGLVVCVAVLLAAGVFGLVRRRRDGRVRVRAGDEGVRLTAQDLGATLGERATLVQFSSFFCRPCRATHQVLEQVAGAVDGVAHIEVDAESRLDLVRRLEILRTPTVLVLDASGRVVRRAAGQPRREDVVAALAEAV